MPNDQGQYDTGTFCDPRKPHCIVVLIFSSVQQEKSKPHIFVLEVCSCPLLYSVIKNELLDVFKSLLFSVE